MMRNAIVTPRPIRRGRRSTHCSFHRECEALNKGRGIGFCDLDGNETICDGDRCFCNKLDALRDYFLRIGKKDEVRSVKVFKSRLKSPLEQKEEPQTWGKAEAEDSAPGFW